MKYLKIFAVLFALILVFSANDANSQSRRRARKKANLETVQWRYEVQGVGTGREGTYLLKVWSYSKSPQVAIEQAKKNAVHGIIFKGYVGVKQGVSTQKPLVNSLVAAKEHEQFFKKFFADGGDYMKYVSMATDGAVAASDRMKISKKEFKIGVVVSVRKDELRKELERQGIVKGLSSMF